MTDAYHIACACQTFRMCLNTGSYDNTQRMPGGDSDCSLLGITVWGLGFSVAAI